MLSHTLSINQPMTTVKISGERGCWELFASLTPKALIPLGLWPHGSWTMMTAS